MGKVVYVAMSADILHNGHLNIIKKANSFGDVVVGLLTDKAIASYKRVPFMNYQQRYEVVSSIKNVKKVIPQETLDYTDNLMKLSEPLIQTQSNLLGLINVLQNNDNVDLMGFSEVIDDMKTRLCDSEICDDSKCDNFCKGP